jgi:MFS family permease
MAENEGQTRKTVRTFAIASFLNDMGSDIIYPVWPLFVTQVLKADMAALGLLDGLGEALVSLSQAASGYLSDRIRKRKVFIWVGYLCGALSRFGYAAASVWQHLIPFRVLDRAGKMRGAPRDALVADVSTDENRGRHFGLLRAMDNLGASSPWPPSPRSSARR